VPMSGPGEAGKEIGRARRPIVIAAAATQWSSSSSSSA
jgi:hypothetical protein